MRRSVRCSGRSVLKEQNIDFTVKPCACDGIEAVQASPCFRRSKNRLDANFIEGMACIGGCIGGAGCLTHGEKNKAEVDKYGREAFEKTISDAVSVLKNLIAPRLFCKNAEKVLHSADICAIIICVCAGAYARAVTYHGWSAATLCMNIRYQEGQDGFNQGFYKRAAQG